MEFEKSFMRYENKKPEFEACETRKLNTSIFGSQSCKIHGANLPQIRKKNTHGIHLI